MKHTYDGKPKQLPQARLRNLNPSWVDPPGRTGIGISFDCPHCPAGRRARLTIYFKNPIDGGPPDSRFVVFLREGRTFDELSIAPRIDASDQYHWRGHLIRGALYRTPGSLVAPALKRAAARPPARC